MHQCVFLPLQTSMTTHWTPVASIYMSIHVLGPERCYPSSEGHASERLPLPSPLTDKRDGILKSGCRHVHALSMVHNHDRDALAEQWHNLLCIHDPTHPHFVSTPIAADMDAYTLAYAILLIKEGIFSNDYDAARIGCRCCPDDAQSINTELLDVLLGGAIGRVRQRGRRRPLSAMPNFREMTSEDRLDLLRRTYGGGGGGSGRPSTSGASTRRLYDRINAARHHVPDLKEEVDWSFPKRAQPKKSGWPWNSSAKSGKSAASGKSAKGGLSYGASCPIITFWLFPLLHCFHAVIPCGCKLLKKTAKPTLQN